jgi:hypothetical protein
LRGTARSLRLPGGAEHTPPRPGPRSSRRRPAWVLGPRPQLWPLRRRQGAPTAQPCRAAAGVCLREPHDPRRRSAHVGPAGAELLPSCPPRLPACLRPAAAQAARALRFRAAQQAPARAPSQVPAGWLPL